MVQNTCLPVEAQTGRESPAFSAGLHPLAEGLLPSTDFSSASLAAAAVLTQRIDSSVVSAVNYKVILSAM